MASFAEQIRAHQAAHLAAVSIEAVTRQQIEEAFNDWDQGTLTAQTVRHRLENIVRTSYRSSAAIARELTAQQAGLGTWKPQTEIFRTEYLDALLDDVRRNLREYKAGESDEADRRRAILRMQHSAGVGAQRGYTDQIIAGYSELEDFGYEVRKIWSKSNRPGHVACDFCRALHGTEVGLHEEFPGPVGLKIYHNLIGPPRHPRCACFLIVFIVFLENAFEDIDLDDQDPVVPTTMTSDDVKKLPAKVFNAIRKSLKVIKKIFRGGSDGK